jgi:hypothetical protein
LGAGVVVVVVVLLVAGGVPLGVGRVGSVGLTVVGAAPLMLPAAASAGGGVVVVSTVVVSVVSGFFSQAARVVAARVMAAMAARGVLKFMGIVLLMDQPANLTRLVKVPEAPITSFPGWLFGGQNPQFRANIVPSLDLLPGLGYG